jgi:hypothetical protein
MHQVWSDDVPDIVSNKDSACGTSLLCATCNVRRCQRQQEDVGCSEDREEIVPEEREPSLVPGPTPQNDSTRHHGQAAYCKENSTSVLESALPDRKQRVRTVSQDKVETRLTAR